MIIIVLIRFGPSLHFHLVCGDGIRVVLHFRLFLIAVDDRGDVGAQLNVLAMSLGVDFLLALQALDGVRI